ncbi:hypothetical protein ACQ859_16475 [Roseateles chitinivorans]|uniref:hypothetical protein n=1 Tax=Roseateles chitinivorans TaxID=2917965 RepID=UPI003D6700EE
MNSHASDRMRQQYLQAVAKFEPFTALYGLGADPAAVKDTIILLLGPYVRDQDVLVKHAVSVLAGEAISVARLLSSPERLSLFKKCLAIREAAIAADETRAFEAAGYFEAAILEAQQSFGLLVSFEVSKDDLSLEEAAFELFRTLGTLIESNLQLYLKELHCLLAIGSGVPVDLDSVSRADFGHVCELIDKSLANTSLLTPPPWGIRINQWRNIAQHHSFSCANNTVVVRYGKGSPQKQASLARPELLDLARSVVWRLGALKTSRALTHFNHLDRLKSHLPPAKPHPYNDTASLAASFASQGFRLSKLDLTETEVDAIIEDTAPGEDLVRPIHCSQFVASIAQLFPDRSVRIRYVVNDAHLWTFSAGVDALAKVMALDEPLKELAHVVQFKREPN